MKKHYLSLLGLLSLAAVLSFAFWPTTADAHLPPPIDPPTKLYLCYDAHLSVCTDPGGCGGGYNLGWNEGAGSSASACQSLLNSMIGYADSQGWIYANAHCYSYTSQRPCRIGGLPG
ncbi:MAG: hypothetical protein AAGC60_27415 [Acidobacteriota bacterium]